MDKLVGWFADGLIGGMIGRMIGEMIGGTVAGIVGEMIGGTIGEVVAGIVGRLVAAFVKFLQRKSTGKVSELFDYVLRFAQRSNPMELVDGAAVKQSDRVDQSAARLKSNRIDRSAARSKSDRLEVVLLNRSGQFESVPVLELVEYAALVSQCAGQARDHEEKRWDGLVDRFYGRLTDSLTNWLVD